MGRKKTTKEFVLQARVIHGDRYDYSKVEYTGSDNKICIICPDHGEFWLTANNHLRGWGCLKCAKKLKTTEKFIKEAKAIHGDKYDYSKVEYVNLKTKVCIICKEHGKFWQTPLNHLHNHGCPVCAGCKKKTTEEFIEEVQKVHGDKYNYSKVEYKNEKDKVCIICPKHGEFWQNPNNHLHGAGCPKCAGRNKTTDQFIEEAHEIHNNKYDYSKTNYVDCYTKVCIICPEHGEFWQSPSTHLIGHGCPVCNSSKGEMFVKSILDTYKIPYKREFILKNEYFEDHILRIDFFVKYNNKQFFIEYNGEQHYIPKDYFGGELGFEYQTWRDQKLRDFCELHKNKVQLLEIKYDEMLDEILENKILNFIEYGINNK